MADEIVVATTAGDYEVFGGLIGECWDWLHARYAVRPTVGGASSRSSPPLSSSRCPIGDRSPICPRGHRFRHPAFDGETISWRASDHVRLRADVAEDPARLLLLL